MRKCRISDFRRTVSVFALFLCLCLIAAFFAPAAFADNDTLPYDLAAVISNLGNLGAMEAMSQWDNLAAVSVGHGSSGVFVLGLREDGTVLAAGNNDRGQCDVEEWSDITEISAGKGFALGLKRDGTALCAGFSDYDLTELESWENLCNIAAGECFALGVTQSGQQLFAGCGEFDINLWFSADTENKVWENKEEEMDFWSSLSGVCTAGDNILAMDTLGQLRYFGFTPVGDMPEFQKTVADYEVSLYNGAVLFNDGTALVWGDNSCGQCPSFELSGISQLSLGAEHSVFLRDDGTVFACGSNEFGQRDVSDWQNIVYVEAGDTCTLGITQEGKLLAAGVIR